MAQPDPHPRREVWHGVDSAWTMSVELLTATFVWGGIGWVLDTYVFHTTPWVMVGGFILGFALGMYLLYLRMQEDARAEEERRSRR